MSRDPRQPEDPKRAAPTPGGPVSGGPVSGGPASRGPDQIDELDLLGWVEGDLPRARQQPVEALLAKEARLRDLLGAMASDRDAIRSLSIERAPAELLAGVEARLERDLLVGLSGADAAPLSIPLPRVVVRGEGVLARIGRAPVARIVGAAAAVIALSAVGVVMLNNDGARPRTEGVEPPVLLGAGPGGVSEGTALASATPEAAPTESDVDPVPSLSALASAEPAPSPLTQEIAAEVSPERAAELVREGRLVLVVRTLDRDRTIQRLATIHAEPRPTWMLLDRADASLALALDPRPAPAATIDPMAMASSRSDPARGVLLPPSAPDPARQRAVYLAEADATPRALAALRGALSAGRSQAAHFVALETPLGMPEANSIDSVLWWNRPPSGWVRRFTLPIVVEPTESR